MPHVTLEYTSNVVNVSDWGELLIQVHKIIHQIAGVEIENCKGRLLEHSRFTVGSGGKHKAFVHLEVAFLDGRSAMLKAELGNMLLNLLQTRLLPENSGSALQITVEIRDIIRKDYFKFPKGTISKY